LDCRRTGFFLVGGSQTRPGQAAALEDWLAVINGQKTHGQDFE
jgi:hypothetical protein